MSESVVGVASTAILQNAGSDFEKEATAGDIGAPVGDGLNAPATTDCAEVIFACGRETWARSSHDLPVDGEFWAKTPLEKKAAIITTANILFIARFPP
jgi:hypothetical protein